eukprot:1271417-Rhodomonas_salina.1
MLPAAEASSSVSTVGLFDRREEEGGGEGGNGKARERWGEDGGRGSVAASAGLSCDMGDGLCGTGLPSGGAAYRTRCAVLS